MLFLVSLGRRRKGEWSWLWAVRAKKEAGVLGGGCVLSGGGGEFLLFERVVSLLGDVEHGVELWEGMGLEVRGV
jgi:hypothetical protein